MKDNDIILNTIDTKIDDLKDKVYSLELSQVKALNDIHSILKDQHVSLELHMKRSDALETQVDILKDEVKPVLVAYLSSVKFFKILFGVVSFIMSALMIYSRLKR